MRFLHKVNVYNFLSLQDLALEWSKNIFIASKPKYPNE